MRVDEVIDAYHELGYTILAMTDHDRLTWPWQAYGRDPESLGMVAVVGNELTRSIHHFLSIFTDYEPVFSGRLSREEPLADRNAELDGLIAGIGDAGGIGIIAHPSRDWPINFVERRIGALDLPLDSDLRNITQSDFTIETWFKTDDQGRGVLLGNYINTQNNSLNLELHTDNRVRVFFSARDEGISVNLNESANSIGVNTRDGQWHHLAATREGRTVRLFLNGQELGSSDRAEGSVELGGDFMHIGRDHRTGNTTFHGSLDQVRLWTRALSSGELIAIQEGQAPSLEALLRYFPFNPSEPIPAEGVSPDSSMLANKTTDQGINTGAIISETGHPTVDHSVPPVLGDAGISTASLSFGSPINVDPAAGVPDVVFRRYVEILVQNPHVIGMEVLNGTRSSDYPFCRALWDDLLVELMPGRPVWGFANDDLHSVGHLGRDWNVILIDRLEEYLVRESLENGAFFFASIRPVGDEAAVERTPEIRKLRHDSNGGLLIAQATEHGQPSAEDSYVWISHGEVVHVGPTLNYRNLPSETRYVRLEVTGQGGIIHSNPIGLATRN